MTFTIDLVDDQYFSILDQLARANIIRFSSDRKAETAAAPPKVSRAQLEEWMKNDPVIQRLLTLPVKTDWSWLPPGYSPDTLTNKQIRELRLREKYGEYFN